MLRGGTATVDTPNIFLCSECKSENSIDNESCILCDKSFLVPSEFKESVYIEELRKKDEKISQSHLRRCFPADKVDRNVSSHINANIQNLILYYPNTHEATLTMGIANRVGRKSAEGLNLAQLGRHTYSSAWCDLIWTALKISKVKNHDKISKAWALNRYPEESKELASINGWAEYAMYILTSNKQYDVENYFSPKTLRVAKEIYDTIFGKSISICDNKSLCLNDEFKFTTKNTSNTRQKFNLIDNPDTSKSFRNVYHGVCIDHTPYTNNFFYSKCDNKNENQKFAIIEEKENKKVYHHRSKRMFSSNENKLNMARPLQDNNQLFRIE